MDKDKQSTFLNTEFDTNGLNLKNFTSLEADYLKKYGNFLEALTLGQYTPHTTAQKDFVNFIVTKYILSRRRYNRKSAWPNTIEMKVWEKVLLSDEYYNRISNQSDKLDIRNYFVFNHIDFFSIMDPINELVVYFKISGRSKPGDDETVHVSFDYKFGDKTYDRYIYSLFSHEQIGKTIYQESGFASYTTMGKDYIASEEGIIKQVDCKKIEVEMKINALHKYSKKEHQEFYHLTEYNHIEKYLESE